MKVLIVYTGKTGTTEECVGILRAHLTGPELTVCRAQDAPVPDGFDAVILGGSVRYGKVDKTLTAYMHAHADALAQVPLGLFLCLGKTPDFDETAEAVFPEALRRHAFELSCFGGSLDPKRFPFFERIVVRLYRYAIKNAGEHDEEEYEWTLPAVNPENIRRMADACYRAVSEEF